MYYIILVTQLYSYHAEFTYSLLGIFLNNLLVYEDLNINVLCQMIALFFSRNYRISFKKEIKRI